MWLHAPREGCTTLAGHKVIMPVAVAEGPCGTNGLSSLFGKLIDIYRQEFCVVLYMLISILQTGNEEATCSSDP